MFKCGIKHGIYPARCRALSTFGCVSLLTVIYLHGFNSAFDPESSKVLQLCSLAGVREVIGVNVAYHTPEAAEKLYEGIIEVTRRAQGRVVLVGTSLGGFYARYLGQRLGVPLVQINPALEPWITLRRAIGVIQENFKTGEQYSIDEAWVDGLQILKVPRLEVPALSVIAEDDELLSFDRSTLDALQLESKVVLTQGGHRLEVLPSDVVAAIAQFFLEID